MLMQLLNYIFINYEHIIWKLLFKCTQSTHTHTEHQQHRNKPHSMSRSVFVIFSVRFIYVYRIHEVQIPGSRKIAYIVAIYVICSFVCCVDLSLFIISVGTRRLYSRISFLSLLISVESLFIFELIFNQAAKINRLSIWRLFIFTHLNELTNGLIFIHSFIISRNKHIDGRFYLLSYYFVGKFFDWKIAKHDALFRCKVLSRIEQELSDLMSFNAIATFSFFTCCPRQVALDAMQRQTEPNDIISLTILCTIYFSHVGLLAAGLARDHADHTHWAHLANFLPLSEFAAPFACSIAYSPIH